MKKIIGIMFLSIFGPPAFASGSVVSCEISYAVDASSSIKQRWFYNVGEMSVQNCINLALKSKKLTSNQITLKYSHYTRTTGANVDIDSAGWSVTAKIITDNVKPSQLDYVEFVNP